MNPDNKETVIPVTWEGWREILASIVPYETMEPIRAYQMPDRLVVSLRRNGMDWASFRWVMDSSVTPITGAGMVRVVFNDGDERLVIYPVFEDDPTVKGAVGTTRFEVASRLTGRMHQEENRHLRAMCEGILAREAKVIGEARESFKGRE